MVGEPCRYIIYDIHAISFAIDYHRGHSILVIKCKGTYECMRMGRCTLLLIMSYIIIINTWNLFFMSWNFLSAEETFWTLYFLLLLVLSFVVTVDADIVIQYCFHDWIQSWWPGRMITVRIMSKTKCYLCSSHISSCPLQESFELHVI